MLIKKAHNLKIFIKISVIITLLMASAGILTYSIYQMNDLDKQISSLHAQIALKSIDSAAIVRKKMPVYINLPGAKPVKALVSDYNSNDNIWKIVSKTKSIDLKYEPTDLAIPSVKSRTDKSDSERSVRTIIHQPLTDMFAAASSAGYQLMIGSGYRSSTLQATYFNSLAASVGDTAANNSIARPGQSEHQLGLAVDLATVSRQCYLDNCFGSTTDGQWLVNNSYKFGFILRYPSGKESITGYQYESWHFRYVGVELATALYDSKLTLDEAWPYMEKALGTLHDNGAL